MSLPRYDLTEDLATGEVDITPVPETQAGGYVAYEDYAALEARCAALAAENAGLNSVIEAVRGVANESIGIAGWHKNGEIATWEEILPEIDDIETPATDAFLAEVRAQGADECVRQLVISDDDDFSDAPNICAMVAHQLRKGGA